MTDDRTLERAARSWLEEGPTLAPDRAVDGALSRIQTISQERDLRIPWRSPAMNRFVIPAMTALAVVLVAVLLVPRFASNNVGPQPSSTPVPTIASSPSPTPRAMTRSMEGGTLGAATYAVTEFAVPFTITLPSGWVIAGFKPHDLVLRQGDSTFLAFVVMDSVYPDPCHSDGNPTPVGAGVGALVDALSSMKGFRLDGLADATVGGAPGKSFTLTNSIDLEADNCTNQDVVWIGRDGDDVPVLEGAPGADPVWVVDVAGTTLLIGGPAAALAGVTFGSATK